MVIRKVIKIDEEKCNGCGQCVTSCAEGALEIIDGKAKVVRDSFCDGLGACIGECPEDALKIEERDVEEFDKEAVKDHLKEKEHHLHDEKCGCPSAKPIDIKHAQVKPKTEVKMEKCGCPSAAPLDIHHKNEKHMPDEHEQEAKLGHWPIQLMLVPESAPFLKGKDLIVLADCSAVAYGNLQNEFVDGNVIVMGCPKFDDINIYEKKLEGMIKNSGIRSISVVHMEVPCCFGLLSVVKSACQKAGNKIPFKQHVVGINGEIKQ